MKIISFIIIAPVVIFEICFAQNSESTSLITDRPDFTESAETVPFKRIQFETGYTFARNGLTKKHTVGELLPRIGIHNRTELRIGFNSYVISRQGNMELSGFEDMEAGFKAILHRPIEGSDPAIPQIALVAGTSLPTGSTDFKSDKLQPCAKLALAWDLSNNISLGSNINYQYLNENPGQFSQFGGSVSMGFSLSDMLGCYVEYFGFAPGSKNGSNLNYVNSGMTYLINNDCQFDLRGGVGINGENTDYFVGMGMALRL